LSIRFLESEYFLRAEDGKPIAENYTITEKIPMQLIFTSGMLKIEKASEEGVKTLTYLVLGNIALQLFM
jgi:hypothetical protein